MSNPTLPVMTDAEADALSDVVHVGTGTRHVAKMTTDASSPKLFTRLKMVEKFYGDLLARFGAACVSLGGLYIGVFALEYKVGAADKSFAGVASQALSPSTVSYLYLDADQTLKVATGAWPGGDIFRVAKVTTNGSAVTGIIDARLHNFLIGIANAWYSVPAAGDVDMNAKALKSVAQMWFTASTELTIASDVVTPTQIMHSVDTQADAAADDLVTITADAAKINRLLILRCENAGRVVTIKSTGNIKLKHGDLVLDDVEKFVICMQITATTWICEPMNFESFGPLLQDLDCNGKTLSNIGLLNSKLGTDQAIAADAITVTTSGRFRILPESGSTDELSTINGGSDGDWLLIAPASNGYAITVNDAYAAGGDNIRLAVIASTLVISNLDEWLLLHNEGGLWLEASRPRWKLSMLVGTGQVIPYALSMAYPGALTTNQHTWHYPVLKAFTLKRARGNVVTAPAGGSCIVDIQKNGASIFASDAARINIAVGAYEDTSDTVTVSFAVNDVLSVKVLTPNSAVDLTVAFDAFVDAAAAN
jgi:hypothetical protein